MPEFDPSKPNVMKWNDMVDLLAKDIITFVDDLRASGYDRENDWQVARQITSCLQYLGIQDAAGKRVVHPLYGEAPGQEPFSKSPPRLFAKLSRRIKGRKEGALFKT